MIRDTVSFERIWKRLYGDTVNSKAIIAFVQFIEKKFAFEAVYDSTQFLHGRVDMADLFALAEQMHDAGVILEYHKNGNSPDEPQVSFWGARYRDSQEEGMSGGCTLDDDRHSLTCALAEGLERHIWFECDDYFKQPIIATTAYIAHTKKILAPESFAGFSEAQRKEKKSLALAPEKEFLWIRGSSLHDVSPIWIPAQVISAAPRVNARRKNDAEPLIRRVVTTGLATHPDRTQALLSGALEIIERDAYIITWLNRLSPARVDIDALCTQSASLQKLVNVCRRYRLQPHILRLPTDAPAYAIGAVLKDETGNGPVIALGLKAGSSLETTAEKAIIEALRGRRGARTRFNQNEKPDPAAPIGHYDRLTYWADPSNSEKLEFLIKGPIEKMPGSAWDHDTPERHLQRIVAWCSAKNYGCASVAFTSSKGNCTPWHIEMVVIPELQPLYYSESLPHIGGARLTEIPTQFGYKIRTPFFTEEPHPFA